MKLCIRSANTTARCENCGAVPQELHKPIIKHGRYCPRCCPACATSAPQPAAPKKAAAPQPVRAPAVPVLHGNPNPSQPPSGDPWYRDTPDDRAARSTGDRGSRPWIPNLPDWFQPGNGRRGGRAS